MARVDGKPENQHYVPRLLLKNFVTGEAKDAQIYVYDKRNKRSFLTNISKIAAERAFYDLNLKVGVLSFESALSEMETKSRAAITKIVAEETLSTLNDEDKAWLAIFLACQRTRTRHFRESIMDSDRQLAALLTDRGINPQEIENYKPLSGEEEVKRFATTFMIRSLPEFAAQMLYKKWVLMRADPRSVFLIGDNPITLHNDQDFGPYGNIGLSVAGIQIHLPLSPNLTLALWCPSLADQIPEALKQTEKSLKQLDAILTLGQNVNVAKVREAQTKLRAAVTRLRPDALALESGRPLQCEGANMDFFNSLQILWAERFVMSRGPEFPLVERMLRESPDLQKGPRMRVG